VFLEGTAPDDGCGGWAPDRWIGLLDGRTDEMVDQLEDHADELAAMVEDRAEELLALLAERLADRTRRSLRER
jgi:hypothetical protein